MTDTENFEEPEVSKTKTKKPRKPMSDERKAQLREQLKAAREKSNEIRAKKKLARRIDKEEERKALDEKIAKKVLDKNPVEDEIKALKEEIKSLKESGGSNAELKALREELNLFKQGLKEQIEKAKEQKTTFQKENKPTFQKVNKTNEEPKEPEKKTEVIYKEDVKTQEPETKPTPRFKKIYCSRRGFIQVPV